MKIMILAKLSNNLRRHISFTLLFFTLLAGVQSVRSQEWVMGIDGNQYNCELIYRMIEEFGEEPFKKTPASTSTLADHYAEVILACKDSDAFFEATAPVDFKVTVSSTVNLRSCADTSCKLVGQTQIGDILEVINEDGDWYEVKFGEGTAFIAGWLTTRLPDALVIEKEDSSELESIELQAQSGVSYFDAEMQPVQDSCSAAYVVHDGDASAFAVVFVGEETLRGISDYTMYDSEKSSLTADEIQEHERNGVPLLFAGYANPEHQETYSLQFEYRETQAEVTFEYEQGITGKRNVIGAVIVEC